MDIRKPNAAHSVREFAVEIGTIICGILIALSFEQGIEWLRWRYQLIQAREALAADQRRILSWIGATDKAAPCIAARLQKLEIVLDKAEVQHRLPPLGQNVGPWQSAWMMRGWDGLVSGGVLNHMARGEGERFTFEASALKSMQELRDREAQDWAVLRTMSGPGRGLSDAEAAGLRSAMGRARRDAAFLRDGADAVGGMVVGSKLLTMNDISSEWRHGFDRRVFTCEVDPDGNSQMNIEAASLLRPAEAPSHAFDP